MSILQCCRGRIQIPFITKMSLRGYLKVSEQMELLLKKTDQMPRDYQLVYREVHTRMPSFMYHCVNFLSCTTVATIAVMIYKEKPFFTDEGIGADKGIPIVFGNPAQTAVLSIFGAFIFYIAQVTRKRYPMRIYYSDKKKAYRAIFIGKIPFTHEFYEFPSESMTCYRDTIIPWNKVLFNANGRKIFLFEDKFRANSDFYHMLIPGEFID